VQQASRVHGTITWWFLPMGSQAHKQVIRDKVLRGRTSIQSGKAHQAYLAGKSFHTMGPWATRYTDN
jgi:hypothetical protein